MDSGSPQIQIFNQIAAKGLEVLKAAGFEVAADAKAPIAILVRSHDLHQLSFADSVLAVARAGVGVNNIPVDQLTAQGIPVFNAPGANANAVKELVIAALLISARNLVSALNFVAHLDPSSPAFYAEVERQKKRFVGFELPGNTLGVIGLGAVGVQVANAACALGAKVLGFDPDISIRSAWQLAPEVGAVESLGELLPQVDFLSLHVPLTDRTRGLIDAEELALLAPQAVLLNFSRAEIVAEEALIKALAAQRLAGYVCDFPSPRLHGFSQVTAFPHLGASTRNAEENCAAMVAEQLVEYLADGTVRNAVNFPAIKLARASAHRLAVVNKNIPGMVGQISQQLALCKLNIMHMVNESRGAIACTLIDTDGRLPKQCAQSIAQVDGVLRVRAI